MLIDKTKKMFADRQEEGSASAACSGMPDPDGSDSDDDKFWQQKKQLTQKQREQLEGVKLRGENPGNVHAQKDILKVDTEMKGGLSRAREVFDSLRGQKVPEILSDGRASVVLGDGTRIVLRPTSASGHPKIEITDKIQKVLEKITFK